MLQDLRYAFRSLRAAPGFVTTAVLTLSIGIAVNTIVFSLLYALALRPMPVRDPSRVVRIFPVDRDGRRQNLMSYLDYQAYRDQALDVLDGIVGYIPVEVTLGRGGAEADVREALAYAVTSSYFPILGIEPALGRTFTPAEESVGGEHVAIVSYILWQTRFATAPDVLGRQVAINGRPFTIVGVGPRAFMGTEPLAPDFWVPLSAQPVVAPGADRLRNRDLDWLLVLGRLKRGVTAAAAERRLAVIAGRLAAEYPAANRPVSAMVARGTFFTLGIDVTPVIALVMGTVGLVLVIACANTANLSLARVASRRRELAVRLALGAGRWRIVGHLLAESLLISLCGGAAGLLLSAWTLRLLYPIGVSLLPFQWAGVVLDLTPDARVFIYALVVSMLTGVAFGLAPALQTSTPAIAAALRDEGAIFGIRLDRSALRNALVIVQIAVCLMLLACAALAARALQHVRSLDVGFRADGVVYTSADVQRHGYSPAAATELYRRLTDRAQRLPDVTMVALVSHVPLTGGITRARVRVDGLAARDAECTYTAVSPSYFQTLDMPFVNGRTFSEREASGAAPVAIVSETLARRFWPGETAIGRRITTPRAAVPLTVIGVVRDAVDMAIWREKEIAVYVPASEAWSGRNLHLLVRTRGDVQAAAAALRAEARAIDRDLQFNAAPLDEVLRLWILPSRIAAIAAAILGALALVLASIGIYGVIAYAVSQRTREVGIRIALGANPRAVVSLILRDGGRLVAGGLAGGLVGAVVMARLLTRVLVGVSPLDPVALGGAAAVLAAVALAACYIPARRASRIAPLTALRMP